MDAALLRRWRWITSWLAAVFLFAGDATSAAWAQTEPTGRVAQSSVGQVGTRQTREDAATAINPLAATNGRLQNRIQSRLRTRIDRYYSSQANALSPFEVAADEVRTPSGRRR
jgi:hypothetical protein